jgi:hypothetical protein
VGSIGDSKGDPMSSSHRLRPSELSAAGDDEVRRTATFLLRVFGAEALGVAAGRAETSDQAEDWRRVARAIERLLAEATVEGPDGRILRASP